MFRKKGFWITLIAMLLLSGGGYAAYAYWFAPPEAQVEGITMQTGTVTVGNISITADGSGVLVPSLEIELAFDSSGTLMELLVEVGDKVQAGDVLGWIDDTDARNAVVDAQLGILQAQKALAEAQDTAGLAQAVGQAELAVTQAEANLSTAQSDLDDLLNWAPEATAVEVAQANLYVAQVSYQNTVDKVGMREEQLASTRINLAEAIRNLEEAQANYANAMDGARDWEKNIESTRENATKSLQKAQENLEIAQASYDLAMIDSSAIDVENARIKVLDAQTSLEDLQTPPEEQEIAAARIAVQEKQFALAQSGLDLADAQQALAEADTAEEELSLQQAQLKLEEAQATLAGTTLVAPMAGTVTAVNASVGETVSGAVLTLADLDAPVVQFWVEESDLNSVAVGNRVNIVFEALPDLTYNGEIVSVDPMLVNVSNTTAVQAWASIGVAAHPVALLGEMNVEVEIVAGEANNALLVPVQALRELGEGQYAVFVVGTDDALEMRMVEVGLMDYVNAEILSGLERGEVVSVGESTTTSSTSSSQSTTNGAQGPGGGLPPMFGG